LAKKWEGKNKNKQKRLLRTKEKKLKVEETYKNRRVKLEYGDALSA